jgi:hypothetical protein
MKLNHKVWHAYCHSVNFSKILSMCEDQPVLMEQLRLKMFDSINIIELIKDSYRIIFQK